MAELPKQVIGFVSAVCHLDEGGGADGKGGLPHLHLYLKSREPHICLYRDDIEIILLQANTNNVLPNRTLYGYGYDAYLYTGNQELLEKELIEKEVIFI